MLVDISVCIQNCPVMGAPIRDLDRSTTDGCALLVSMTERTWSSPRSEILTGQLQMGVLFLSPWLRKPDRLLVRMKNKFGSFSNRPSGTLAMSCLSCTASHTCYGLWSTIRWNSAGVCSDQPNRFSPGRRVANNARDILPRHLSWNSQLSFNAI
jgi:hypothetical protein